MDFITGLPVSQGSTVILVVVDRLSKSAHFGALPTAFTASRVADLFISIVVKHHGFPRSIISDRDPVFLSSFWKNLFEMSGTKLSMSSAYHPQTDGQSEVINRTLEQYLRAFTQQKPNTWVSFLPWAEFHYNTSHHGGLKMSPFQALYGRKPPSIPLYTRGSSTLPAVDDALMDRDELLRLLKTNLLAAQHRMIQQANNHRRDLQLSVGDLVLVRLQPYRQNSVRRRRQHKLSKKYYGPFSIIDRIGQVAYRLQLPEGSRIHPVFHISNLKPYRGPTITPSRDLPEESFTNQPVETPLAIVATRTVLVNGSPLQQVLVQWAGCSPDEASWEDWDPFRKIFPSLHLEDKVMFEGGRNDTPPISPTQNSVPRPNENESDDEVVQELGKRQPKKPAWMEDYVCG